MASSTSAGTPSSLADAASGPTVCGTRVSAIALSASRSRAVNCKQSWNAPGDLDVAADTLLATGTIKTGASHDCGKMPETMERPLSQGERLRKARALAEQGDHDYRLAEEADAEFSLRKRAAVACENAFHSLIELADVLIERAGHPLPENHAQRVEALEDIGRADLANLYHRAKDALHISGYYDQRMGRLQRDRLREVLEAIERELLKLS